VKGSEDSEQDDIESNTGKSSRKGSGRIHLVEDLNGHGDRILDLSHDLEDPEKKNDPIHEQLDEELEDLKNYLRSREIDRSTREAATVVMSRMEDGLENERERNPGGEKSFIDKFRSRIVGFFKEKGLIQKVDE